MSKIVAIYCRVSTTEQAEEGYSVGEQQRLLSDDCIKYGDTIYKVYADKGISGKDIKNRPALKELLKDAQEGKFDSVRIWKMNRISRSLKDIILLSNQQQNHLILLHHLEKCNFK